MTSNKRILVIDDNEDLLECMAEAFELTSYSVDIASSGKKGIQMFSSAQYDLVYLDLQMPEMNGVETLKKLREINERIPVIITTAFHGEFFADLKAYEKEGNEFEIMHKPSSPKQVVLVADSLLKNF